MASAAVQLKGCNRLGRERHWCGNAWFSGTAGRFRLGGFFARRRSNSLRLGMGFGPLGWLFGFGLPAFLLALFAFPATRQEPGQRFFQRLDARDHLVPLLGHGLRLQVNEAGRYAIPGKNRRTTLTCPDPKKLL